MRKRDRTGLALAPLFLRLALAVTFIWAGLGKFMARMEVQGEQAAILANYGVIPNPNAPVRPAPAAPEPEAGPETAPEVDPEAPAGGDTDGGGAAEAAGGASGRAAAWASGGATIVLASWQEEPRVLATAADFPEPVEVRRWAGLVLVLHSAIHPGLRDEDSTPKMRLWIDFDPSTEYDPWPRYMALAVAVTELVAGVLLAIGLLARLGALGLAGVMLGAIWLTTVGPALQSGDTVLGILPNHETFGEAWTTPLLQFVLLCMSMAVVFAGPGALSLDRLLLGGPPKPAPAKPAQGGAAKPK